MQRVATHHPAARDVAERLNIVVLGLSITSSWGNGHATTYRALLRAMARRGHQVTFLERDVPWYAANRDLSQPDFCTVHLYQSLDELAGRYSGMIAEADVVIVGSYVPDGVAVGELATSLTQGTCAFYDIDTPVTLANLERGQCEYLSVELISSYDVYLSFTGGPTLVRLEQGFGSPMARPLYCCVDAERYVPVKSAGRAQWDLGYLGTYSRDRQPPLEKLLVDPARRWEAGQFVVAGPQYPAEIAWPENVQRIEHLPPDRHAMFYSSQRFTLNVTRADMRVAGYSPSVRLFEAAACGTPIISDTWPGLGELFELGDEILPVQTAGDVLELIRDMPDRHRLAVADAARQRVLAEHTADRRAEQLEGYLEAAAERRGVPVRR